MRYRHCRPFTVRALDARTYPRHPLRFALLWRIMGSRRLGGSAVVVLQFPSAAKMAAVHKIPMRRCRYIVHKCEAVSGDGAFRASDGAAATTALVAGRPNGRGIRSERIKKSPQSGNGARAVPETPQRHEAS